LRCNFFAVGIANVGHSHRAEQDSIRCFAGVEGRLGKSIAGFLVLTHANGMLIQLKLYPLQVWLHLTKQANRLVTNFRSDAIAPENHDMK